MPTELLLRAPDGSPFVPLPHQRRFFESQAKYRLFVAGIGSGKSICGVAAIVMIALTRPGSVSAVVRYDASRLRDSTWRLLLNMLEASGLMPLVARNLNSPQQLLLEFTNGSRIHGWNGKRWEAFGSIDLDAFLVDEISELETSDCWDQLCARLRGMKGPLRGIGTGLADGRNWYWERFVRDKLADHELFRGASRTNPFLPPGYADGLEAIYGRDKSLILLEGSFDQVEGAVFSDLWDPRIHCLPRRSLPRDWPRYASIDPGYDQPAAMVRAAVDGEGNILIEDFYEESGRITEQWAADMLARNTNPKPQFYVIDPSADRNTHLSPVSVLQTARACGLAPIRTGCNDIGQSIARLRSLLARDPAHAFPAWHPRAGQQGSPRIFFFDDLSRLLFEIVAYRWQRSGGASAMHHPKPVDRDNDGIDALRYLCLEHLTSASPFAPPPMSDFWRQVLELEVQPVSYLEQIGARPREALGARR